MKHDFFRGFDWNNYRQNGLGEKIVREFKELHKIKM